LAILEIILEKIFIKKVHTISLFNFGLIVFLGLMSLVGDEGIWFKLQPCFTGIGVGVFIGVQRLRGKSLFLDMIPEDKKNNTPDFLLPMMEKHVGILFACYGCFMAYVALKLTTAQWIFYKTIGFYIVFAVFMLVEFLVIRIMLKKLVKNKK
jgi:intracellular septation protein